MAPARTKSLYPNEARGLTAPKEHAHFPACTRWPYADVSDHGRHVQASYVAADRPTVGATVGWPSPIDHEHEADAWPCQRFLHPRVEVTPSAGAPSAWDDGRIDISYATRAIRPPSPGPETTRAQPQLWTYDLTPQHNPAAQPPTPIQRRSLYARSNRIDGAGAGNIRTAGGNRRKVLQSECP